MRNLFNNTYMDEAKGADEGAGAGDANEVDQATLDKADADAATVIAAKTESEKSKVTDAEAKLLKEVMDKKAALTKTKEELTAAKTILAQLEELGGVDALKALALEKKDTDAKKLEEKGEWSRLKQQMNDEHGKVLTDKVNQIEGAIQENKKLQEQISDLTVGSAFATSTFIKEGLIMPISKVKTLYGGHFEFKDGAVVAYDKPVGYAERTLFVDAKGDPLGFDLAMAKIIDADPDREHLLKSKAKAGAGSTTITKTKAATDLNNLRGSERVSAALAKGELK